MTETSENTRKNIIRSIRPGLKSCKKYYNDKIVVMCFLLREACNEKYLIVVFVIVVKNSNNLKIV